MPVRAGQGESQIQRATGPANGPKIPPGGPDSNFNLACTVAVEYTGVMKLTITTHAEQAERDRAYWRIRTPEERLDEVERLRREAGKFLYEYTSRLRRTVAVARRTRP